MGHTAFSVVGPGWDAAPVTVPSSEVRPSASAGWVTRHPELPLLAVVVVVVTWGLGPPVSKLISAPPVVAVAYRMTMSVPLLIFLTYASGGRFSVELLRRTALAGAAFGINLCFVFATFGHASIAVLSVISALQPGIVLVIAGPLMGERPTRWAVMWTLVGILGTTIVILGADGEIRASPLGVLFATLSMVTFTTYFLINKRVRTTHDITAIEWLTGATTVAALTVVPLAFLTASPAELRSIGGADWLWLAVIIAVTGLTGHVLMSWATRWIDASRSSLYVLAMHIVAVGAAWMIHGERVTPVQGIGGVVVLFAVGAVVSRPA